MNKYRNIIVAILLAASAVLAGIGMIFFAIEHVWMMVLMILCLVGALVIENKNKGNAD